MPLLALLPKIYCVSKPICLTTGNYLVVEPLCALNFLFSAGFTGDEVNIVVLLTFSHLPTTLKGATWTFDPFLLHTYCYSTHLQLSDPTPATSIWVL